MMEDTHSGTLVPAAIAVMPMIESGIFSVCPVIITEIMHERFY